MNRDTDIQKLIEVIYRQIERAQTTIVTVSGPSGSGKSTVVRALQKVFPDSLLIATDDYYIGKTRMKLEMPAGHELDFDHPTAIDIDRLAGDVNQLKAGRAIDTPLYDMLRSEPRADTLRLTPRPLVIVEGIVANCPTLHRLSDMSICVTAPLEMRLARRIERDKTRKNHTPKETKNYMLTVVEPAYTTYFAAWDQTADMIVRNDT